MVYIKEEMNMKEDLADMATKKTKLQAKLDKEADAAKKQDLAKEIADIDTAHKELTANEAKMPALIQEFITKNSAVDAVALTIEAKIAKEEAGIALDDLMD